MAFTSAWLYDSTARCDDVSVSVFNKEFYRDRPCLGIYIGDLTTTGQDLAEICGSPVAIFEADHVAMISRPIKRHLT